MSRPAPRLLHALTWLLLAVMIAPAQAQDDQRPRFSMGGFFKLHVMAGGISAERDRSGDSELWIPDIAVGPSSRRNWQRLNMHARESRIWMRAEQQTPLGPLEALVEGDLDGDRAEGHEPRLRHAYVILGPMLAGQTYTTFTNTSALADIDSGIAVGNVVTRHRLVRWQQSIDDQTSVSLAVEEPLNRLHFSGTDRILSSGDRRPPDVVVRLDRSGDWGNTSVSLLAREITTTVAPAPGVPTDSRLGTAISVAGRVETGALDNLRFMFNYGNALARYSTLATFADATVRPDGRVRLATTYSGLLAWQHFWSPRWRSSLALSFSRSAQDSATSRQLTRASRSAHANLIWAANRRFSLGIEYLAGWRSLLNGNSGNLHRVQVTTRLNF